VETEIPVLLLSAPSAAASVGPAWFAAVAAAAVAGYPEAPVEPVLDCGALAGHALAAIRHGLKTIRYDGPAFDAVADIAAQSGATVLRERPASLDLGDLPPGRGDDLDACRRWLRTAV
jgi:hypothetical protein